VYLPNRTLCCVDFAFGNVIINAQVRVHNVAEAVALGNGTGSGNVLILAPFLARTCGRNAMKLRPHHPPTLALFRTSCKWMQRKWNEFVRAAKTQPTSCNESCEHFTNGLQLMSADVSKKNTIPIYIYSIYVCQWKIYKAMRKVWAVMGSGRGSQSGNFRAVRNINRGNLSLWHYASVSACEARDFPSHGCVYRIVEYPVKSKFLFFEQSLT